MHSINVLNKSTSNESIKKNDRNDDNAKENNLQQLTETTTAASFTSIDAERSPLSITSHSSIQHNRQELYHQYGTSSSTDSTNSAKKPIQHPTVTFSSEINLANQARCSVLQVVQADKPASKTIKSIDLNRPHLQLNFAHSFRHPVSGSLDETASNAGSGNTQQQQLSAVHVVNRGSTFLSSKSPSNQYHHTILHQLPPTQTSATLNQNVLYANQTAAVGQLTSPSYRAINLNTGPSTGVGLSANDIYRGRRCFKRSISLASAQPHPRLNQQMSLTQPFAGSHRKLLADYGRRRANLDSFE